MIWAIQTTILLSGYIHQSDFILALDGIGGRLVHVLGKSVYSASQFLQTYFSSQGEEKPKTLFLVSRNLWVISLRPNGCPLMATTPECKGPGLDRDITFLTVSLF